MLTTHDLSQAEAIASRVAFMFDGCIRLRGCPKELILREFNHRKELKIVLREQPDDAGASILASLALKPARGSITWNGPVDADLTHVGDLTARLEDSGIATAEVRLREPGLESVLLRLTGEEMQL